MVEWIEDIDEDGDGELDFPEFARMMAKGKCLTVNTMMTMTHA